MSILAAGIGLGAISGLMGTGFNIAQGLTSASQARKQKRYFQEIAREYNAQYQKSRSIKLRSNKIEQGQYTQQAINAGIEASGKSQSFAIGQQNLRQVQAEELQQMDFANRMQQIGFQRQVANAGQMAQNYTMSAIGSGVSGIMSLGNIAMDAYGMYQGYQGFMGQQRQIGLNSAMQAQGGRGFGGQYGF